MSDKFIQKTPALAEAFDRLENLASEFINAETGRRIQASREKENRQIEAYQYLIELEEKDITENQLALETVKSNLLDRGVELNNLSDEYKGVNAEELLNAANEGSIQMLSIMHDDSVNQRNSLKSRLRDSNEIKRQVDVFDELVSQVQPDYAGDKKLIEADDVAVIYNKYMDQLTDVEKKSYQTYLDQRFDELKSEAELEKLQADYLKDLQTNINTKQIIDSANTIDAKIDIANLQDVKTQVGEGLKSMMKMPSLNMVMPFQEIVKDEEMFRTQEDESGSTIQSKDLKELEAKIQNAYATIGVQLFPWAVEGQHENQAKGLLFNLKRSGEGAYDDLISYFTMANMYYKESINDPSKQKRAERFRQDLLGFSRGEVDISNENWINQLLLFSDKAGSADEEQALRILEGMYNQQPVLDTDPVESLPPEIQNYLDSIK
jgi:hypothetical protein